MKFFLFGLIQGITEFIPISSDGHLFLLKRLFGISDNYLPFFVFLHIPTLLAVVIFFRKELLGILLQKTLVFYIFILTIITGVVALLIKYFLGGIFDNKYFVSICFAINALILFLVNFRSDTQKNNNFTIKDSLIIGFMQAIAVLPGISRSGITIMGLARRKFKPEHALSLSFVISIPIIIAAFLVERKDLLALKDISKNYLIIGFFSALFFGIISLKILKTMLRNLSFKVLGYYCLLVAVLNLFL